MHLDVRRNCLACRWFFAIAANLIHDMYRKGHVLRRSTGVQGRGDHSWLGGTSIAESAITACEDTEAVHRLLETLPAARCEVLQRRFVRESMV